MEIEVGNGRSAIIDDKFSHLSEWKWYLDNKGYAVRQFRPERGKQRTMYMHQAIIGRPLNRSMEIDHINGDRLDNREVNLRHVTRRGNAHNRIEHRLGNSVGVRLRPGRKRWEARIRVNGKTKTIGLFDSKEDAVLAVENACAA